MLGLVPVYRTASPVCGFGADGGGMQYLFNSSIDDLVEQGSLRELPCMKTLTK
jgi:hypothetical protein